VADLLVPIRIELLCASMCMFRLVLDRPLVDRMCICERLLYICNWSNCSPLYQLGFYKETCSKEPLTCISFVGTSIMSERGGLYCTLLGTCRRLDSLPSLERPAARSHVAGCSLPPNSPIAHHSPCHGSFAPLRLFRRFMFIIN